LNSFGLGSGLHWSKKVVFLFLEEANIHLPFGDQTGRSAILGSLAMFQIPAYDPVAIAMMGFGVLLVAALAFVL
jgi:hypothetical protein